MKTKICTNKKCLQPEKPLSEFHKDASRKDGYRDICKICVKQYQIKNRKTILLYKKQYRSENKEKITKQCSEYRDNNKEKIKIQQKENRERAKILYPWKRVLYGIRHRCNNSNSTIYQYYGKKGIKCLITEEELKFLWFRDKAYNMKKPSIDRKNNNGNYEVSNCRFIELVDNIKRRSLVNFSKPVLQYDLDKNFIGEYLSISEASQQTRCHASNISCVLRGIAKEN